jgi:hypothetical protein
LNSKGERNATIDLVDPAVASFTHPAPPLEVTDPPTLTVTLNQILMVLTPMCVTVTVSIA